MAPWWAATAGSAHRGAVLLANQVVCATSVANVSTALVAALALRPARHLSGNLVVLGIGVTRIGWATSGLCCGCCEVMNVAVAKRGAVAVESSVAALTALRGSSADSSAAGSAGVASVSGAGAGRSRAVVWRRKIRPTWKLAIPICCTASGGSSSSRAGADGQQSCRPNRHSWRRGGPGSGSGRREDPLAGASA